MDFDGISREKSIENLKKAVDLLQDFHPNVRFQTRIRVSGGKSGYHGQIIGNGNEEIENGIAFLVRQVCGDDKLRIEIDRKRKAQGVSYDKLFDSYSKNGQTYLAGKWERIV